MPPISKQAVPSRPWTNRESFGTARVWETRVEPGACGVPETRSTVLSGAELYARSPQDLRVPGPVAIVAAYALLCDQDRVSRLELLANLGRARFAVRHQRLLSLGLEEERTERGRAGHGPEAVGMRFGCPYRVCALVWMLSCRRNHSCEDQGWWGEMTGGMATNASLKKHADTHEMMGGGKAGMAMVRRSQMEGEGCCF